MNDLRITIKQLLWLRCSGTTRIKAVPRAVVCVAMALIAAYASARDGVARDYTPDQQLVIAAFNLEVERVQTLLVGGANPNARLGFYDDNLFGDKWRLAYSPIGSDKWTPLLAVANSHQAPQPMERTENTSAAREAAQTKLKSIDSRLIAQRDERRVKIGQLLVAAHCDLDMDDGYGQTALEASVEQRYDGLSLDLISAGAKLDTKTGVYIDGPGDVTPVHHAITSPRVLHAMIKRGVDVNVVDTDGDTPLHWAVLLGEVESVRLLLAAGANVNAIDNDGHDPSHWCFSRMTTNDGFETPEDRVKIEICDMLRAHVKLRDCEKSQEPSCGLHRHGHRFRQLQYSRCRILRRVKCVLQR